MSGTACPIGWRWHSVVAGTVTSARPISGLSKTEQAEVLAEHPADFTSSIAMVDWTLECWGHGSVPSNSTEGGK